MRIDRFGAQDTSEETMEIMYELYRSKTPEEKLRMVVERMQFMYDLRKATEHLGDPQTPFSVLPTIPESPAS